MKTLGKNAAKIASVSMVILLSSFLACNKTSFGTKGSKTNPAPQPNANLVLDGRGIENRPDAGTQAAKENQQVDIIITASGELSNKTNLTSLLPMDLIFVIDSSRSMQEEMISARNTALALVNELQKKNLSLYVGAVGFIDDQKSIEDRVVPLTGDLEAFKKEFDEKIKTVNEFNADLPEASLLAIQNGIDKLTAFGRKNAMKLALVMTDVVGHQGHKRQYWEGQRIPADDLPDCTVESLVKNINSKFLDKTLLPTLFKFYYLTPDLQTVDQDTNDWLNATYVCPGSGFTAEKQMQAIIGSINPGTSVDDRGGDLGQLSGSKLWPVDAESLTNSLVKLLVSFQEHLEEKVCWAKKATFMRNNKPEFTWQANNLQELKAIANNEITIAKVSTLPQLASEEKADIVIERCCFDKGNSITDLNKCDQEYIQIVGYTLKKN